MPVTRIGRERAVKGLEEKSAPKARLPVSSVALEYSTRAQRNFGIPRKDPVETWTPER